MFASFLYPTTCLECGSLDLDPSSRICASCLEYLTVLEKQYRCPYCFQESASLEKGWTAQVMESCRVCASQPPLARRAASFPYEGPAKAIVHAFKFGGERYLSQGMSGYMALQWEQLDWPTPDWIIPVPISLAHLWKRGYNQSKELASAMAHILKRPWGDFLVRTESTVQQRGQSRIVRKRLPQTFFSWRRKSMVEGKIVLLIDDVMTTGATIERCARVVWENHPKAVYALTFCMAE